MADYLYNGKRFPDINTVWTDKETHTHALIQERISGKDLGPGLILSTAPLYYGKYHNPTVPAGATAVGYIVVDGVWTHYYTWEPSQHDASYTNWSGDTIWASYDYLDSSGTVILAASDPIPITAPALDPLSLFMGWKAGNWVARQRGKKVEQPVAYLYNGVRLPDINAVWTDKETYPYAVVLSMDGDTAVFTMPETMIITADGYIGVSADCTSLSYLLADGIWQSGEEIYITAKYGTMFSATCCIWASHDILNSDGTIYLAASEPVPVYE